MSRSALTLLVAATSLIFVSTAPAQTKPAAPVPATPTQSAPAAKARLMPAIRGTVDVNMTRPKTGRDLKTKEIVTKITLKNMMSGSIAGLRVDEYWYDRQGNMLPGDSQRLKKPVLPGEVITIELRVPDNKSFFQNQYKFSHANGEVKTKVVAKVE